MKTTTLKAAFALTAAFLSSPAFAQDTDTDAVLDAVGQIARLHASLSEMTVTMSGAIGSLLGHGLYFKNDHGQFTVQFDAGRSARKSIAECEVELFGWANSNCIVEIDAEIAIEEAYTFANGGKVKLIVYEVRH